MEKNISGKQQQGGAFSSFKLFWLRCLLISVWVMLGIPAAGYPYYFYEKEETRTPNEIRRAEIADLYAGYKRLQFQNAKEVTVAEALKSLKNKKTILVDVRTQKEQDVSQIPFAVTQKDFEQDKDKYLGYVIINYCTIGSRSGRYTKKLMKEGYKAYNLIGGILLWAHEGQPLVRDNKATKKLHVYQEKWSLAPEGYEAVY